MSADMELYEQLRRFARDGATTASFFSRGRLIAEVTISDAGVGSASAGVVAFRNVIRGVEGENGIDRRRRTDAEDVPNAEVPSILHEGEVAGFPAVDLGADRFVRISDDVDASGDGGPVDGDGAFHGDSSRVGASAVAPADASEPTLEAAPGTQTASWGVSGAPSGAVLGGAGAALLAFVVGRFGLLPDSVVIGACAGVAVVALLQMARRRT